MPSITYANESLEYKEVDFNESNFQAKAYAIDPTPISEQQLNELDNDILTGTFTLPNAPQGEILTNIDPETGNLVVVVVIIRVEDIDWIKIFVALR